MQEKERRQQILTDTDVERLAEALEKRVLRHFYINVGKGVFGLT